MWDLLSHSNCNEEYQEVALDLGLKFGQKTRYIKALKHTINFKLNLYKEKSNIGKKTIIEFWKNHLLEYWNN